MKVIGVGNRWRHDDAAGLEVAARLRSRLPEIEVLEREGEPVGLLEAFEGADAVVIVDAVSSGAKAGFVRRLNASSEPLPASYFAASTHHFGLPEAIELARALGRLPERTVVYGIEGVCFEAGEGLSAEVGEAVERAVEAVYEEVGVCTSGS